MHSEKDILIDMVDELEEIVMESSSYTYMKSELSRLNRYRDSLDKMIKKIDKSIKKYEAYTYSKENDLIFVKSSFHGYGFGG